MPEQCPFCKLIENPEQTLDVYETENFKAFLDINPRAEGHTMIVQKEHYTDFEDIPPQILGEVPKVIQAVIKKAKRGLGAEGASVVLNSGEIAGQRVPHIYIQVFPRYENDENAETPAGAVFQPIEIEKERLSEIEKKMKGVDFKIKGSGPGRKDKVTKKPSKKEKEEKEEESKEEESEEEKSDETEDEWESEKGRSAEFR